MKNNKTIHYDFETIDLTNYCRNYLMEHNYLQNDELTNLELVERGLINYSIIKLTADWNFTSDDLKNNITNLLEINKIIDTTIPTEREKEHFFSAYILYILYIFSAINGQSPISLSTNNDIPTNEIIYKYYNDIIIEVIINPKTNYYEIPSKLLDKFKNLYKKKKDPKSR